MCDPVTLALFAASAGVGAVSAISQGQAGAKANRLQTEIARGNADTLIRQAGIERELAEIPLLKGAFETARLHRTGDRVVGGQFAGFQSGGLDPTVGSPLLVQASTAAQIEVDAALIDAQAQLDHASALSRVARTLGEATGQFGNAAGYTQRASDSLVAGVLGAGAAILSAGTKAWSGLSSSAPTPSAGGGFKVGESAGPSFGIA